MLTIMLPQTEESEAVELHFEHSLVSMSKWESLHKKPFFGPGDRTPEEGLSYISMMLLNENPPDEYIERLTEDDFRTINEYVNSQETATTFRNTADDKPSREIVTSELIYAWMIGFGIDKTCETWHLSRLLTLVRIRGIHTTKEKPMSRKAQQEQYRALNAQRKKELGTSG